MIIRPSCFDLDTVIMLRLHHSIAPAPPSTLPLTPCLPPPQFSAPIYWELRGVSILSTLQLAWQWVAIGYPGVALLHWLITTRAG